MESPIMEEAIGLLAVLHHALLINPPLLEYKLLNKAVHNPENKTPRGSKRHSTKKVGKKAQGAIVIG